MDTVTTDSRFISRMVSTTCRMLALTVGVTAASAALAAETTRQQEVNGQYLVRVTLSHNELRRSIYPRFRTDIVIPGDDGLERKLRIPVELYSEVRNYEPKAGGRASSSYERAYLRMVENGDCLPLAVAFGEASFDCGSTRGRRTVAVREDRLGTYFSWESIAVELLPDRADFDQARSVLDSLTAELIDQGELPTPP